MADSTENFVLVSLKEDKAKKLAQVISNDTCRMLLDFLAKKKDASETEISNELKLPLSTVHYNLQHLVEAKLVQAQEFHYSPKGKEVLHYSLTNKFVIIAPRETPETFIEKLRKILPITGIALAAAGIIQAFKMWLSARSADLASGAEPLLMMKAVPEAAPRFIENLDVASEAAGSAAADSFVGAATSASEPNIAVWFLIGALFSIVAFTVIDLLKKPRKV